MLYVSMSLTMIAVIAVMYVWAKTRDSQPHAIYKWLIYLLLLIGFLILACQVSRGLMKMMCHDDNKEMHMRHHPGMMGDMECCPGMGMHAREDKCLEERAGLKKECCDEEDEHHEHMASDSSMSH